MQAVYLNGVLVTGVVSFSPGERGNVSIERRDEDGADRSLQFGRVEVVSIKPGQVPHEYVEFMR